MIKVIEGGVTAPAGFLASGVSCGIKRSGKLDLGVLYSPYPARVAATFTTNRVKAAPVLWDMDKLNNSSSANVILANSGCANACVGPAGYSAVKQSANFLGRQLSLAEEDILVSSTGVIGKPLPLNNVKKGIMKAVNGLSIEGHVDFARSILTTDLVPKESAVEVNFGKHKIKIGGCAKGAGMVNPKMVLHATILVFLTTDAALSLSLLKTALKQAVDNSFNSLTVDGDTSTNDTVFLMANGQSKAPKIADKKPPYFKSFCEGLNYVCENLAKKLAKDGEGATKLIEVVVKGAKNSVEARKAAFAVSNSPLVKTAFFGEDANWGRILGALGYSGAVFDPGKVSISMNGKILVKNGTGVSLSKRQENLLMRPKEIILEIELRNGSSRARVFTCDLSLDYVKINASYRS